MNGLRMVSLDEALSSGSIRLLEIEPADFAFEFARLLQGFRLPVLDKLPVPLLVAMKPREDFSFRGFDQVLIKRGLKILDLDGKSYLLVDRTSGAAR
jgi:hypothetical protein